jgi:hypothetical protein
MLPIHPIHRNLQPPPQPYPRGARHSSAPKGQPRTSPGQARNGRRPGVMPPQKSSPLPFDGRGAGVRAPGTPSARTPPALRPKSAEPQEWITRSPSPRPSPPGEGEARARGGCWAWRRAYAGGAEPQEWITRSPSPQPSPRGEGEVGAVWVGVGHRGGPTPAERNRKNGLHARPHPGPLPQERGRRARRLWKTTRPGVLSPSGRKGSNATDATEAIELSNSARKFSLSPGERAGVRVSLPLTFPRLQHAVGASLLLTFGDPPSHPIGEGQG